MIQQSDFISSAIGEEGKQSFSRKKGQTPIDAIELEIYEEGLCAQILHTGSYGIAEKPDID